MTHRHTFLRRLLLAASFLPLSALAAPAGEMLELQIAEHDTLISISQRLLARPAQWPRLQELNGIADPQRLKPGSTLRIPYALLRSEPQQARVESVLGDVRGSKGPLLAGVQLAVNEVISTGPGAYAVLVLPDGSRCIVQPDSRTRIELLQRLRGTEVQQSRLEVSRGRIETKVQPQRGPAARYEIRTPTAVIGVRGTEFRAGYDGTAARVEVTEGAVAANQQQRIAAGEGAVVDARGVRTETLLPAPATAAIPALFERPLLRIPLPETAGAAAHRVIVAGPGGFALPAAEQLVSGGEVRLADLPDGDYRVRLRAVSASGLEGLHSETAFRLKARPEPPFVSGDRSGGKIQAERVEFSWTRNPEAARYRLQVAGPAGFEAPVFAREDLTGSSINVALAPGEYQWRLGSVRADGDRGPWSDVVSFTLKSPQGPPAAPAISDDELVLAWPAEPGQRFEVEMAQDLAFNQIHTRRETQEARLVLPKPEPGQWFVRVRATDPDGFVGQWSSPQQFEIEAYRPWWLLGVPVLLLLAL